MAKKGSKSRKLTAQEQSLWRIVTKNVVDKKPITMPLLNTENLLLKSAKQSKAHKPTLRKNLKSTTASDMSNIKPLSGDKSMPNIEAGSLLKLMQRFDGNAHITPKPTPKTHSAANTHYITQHELPQNLPLERTIRQKLQRGRADIEGSLDLHGLNRTDAQHQLMSFLKSSCLQGFKTIIIVTGKGDGPISRHTLHSADFYQMPEQRAVLRSLIGDWLNSLEAQPFVIGWQPAHPKHGGGGAVYVRLRNAHKIRVKYQS